jgi:hypothetical protein
LKFSPSVSSAIGFGRGLTAGEDFVACVSVGTALLAVHIVYTPARTRADRLSIALRRDQESKIIVVFDFREIAERLPHCLLDFCVDDHG